MDWGARGGGRVRTVGTDFKYVPLLLGNRKPALDYRKNKEKRKLRIDSEGMRNILND